MSVEAFNNPQDNIKVWWSNFFRISFSFASFLFEKNGHLIIFEVRFRECSKMTKGSKYLSLFIIKSNFFINWAVIGQLRISAKYSEIRIFCFVCFLCLQSSIVEFEFEIVNIENVTDLNVESEIFLSVVPQIHLKGLVLRCAVNNFEFLSIVAIGRIFVNIGCINNESNGRVKFITNLLSKS